MEHSINNIEDFVKAALTISSNSETVTNDDRHDADQQLMQLYRRPEGWQIAQHVIQGFATFDKTVVFNAVIIFKVKVEKYLNEIPAEKLPELLEFILNHILSLRAAGVPGSQRLCDSLVAVYMRLFDKLPVSLFDILKSKLTSADKDTSISVSLSVLESVPSVAQNKEVVIEDEIRVQFMQHLKSTLQLQVLKTLEEIHTNKSHREQIFKCFQNWLFKDTSEAIKLEIHKLELVKAVLSDLFSVQGDNEVAVDVTIDLLHLCKDVTKYKDLYTFVIKNLVGNISVVKDWMKELDESSIFGLMSVLEEFFHRIKDLAISEPETPEILALLETIVMVYEAPELESTDRVCPILSELFDRCNDLVQQGKNEIVWKFVETHKGILKRIIDASCLKCELDEGHMKDSNNLTTKEQNKRRDYENKNHDRKEVQDMLYKMKKAIGFNNILPVIATKMGTTVKELHENPDNVKKLTRFEAELFCILATMKRLNESELSKESEDTVKQLLELLIQLYTLNRRLLHNLLRFLTLVSPLVKNNAVVLNQLYKIVLVGLEDKDRSDIVSSSSAVFKSLSLANRDFVLQNLKEFMQIYNKYFIFDDVIETMSSIVDEIKEEGPRQEGFVSLYKPLVAELKNDECKKDQIVETFRRMTLIVKQMSKVKEGDKSHLHTVIMQEMWGLLSSLLLKYFDSPSIVESICQFIKMSMRCVGHLFGPFIEPYFKIVITNYDKNPVSTYLYTVENALTLFCKDTNYTKWLNDMFTLMVERTYKHLQDVDLKKVDHDLIDDFFGLITRYLRYLPGVVANSKSLEIQMKFGVSMIGIHSVSAEKSLYQFFEELFQYASEARDDNLAIRTLLKEKYGCLILKNTIVEMYKDYPSDKLIDYIDDLIALILTNFREDSVQWFIETFKEVPQAVINNGEKNSFILNLSQKPYDDNREYYKDFFEKFYKRCRTYNSRMY